MPRRLAMNSQEELARQLRELEKRVATLEARERLLLWGLATEDLELIDAGSADATEQDWVEIKVGDVTGYWHVFAAK